MKNRLYFPVYSSLYEIKLTKQIVDTDYFRNTYDGN